MARTCPNCKSKQYLSQGKKLCLKCGALKIEYYYGSLGKTPKYKADYLFDQYFIKKKSLSEIAVENDCSTTNVRNWLIKYEIPVRSRKDAIGNSFDSGFFKKLNPSSAYLLGYFFSDGDLLLIKTTSKYFLRLYSKHKDNIEKVQRLLKTDAKIQYRKEKLTEKVRQGALYFIHVADEEIVKDLIALGMVYDKNQSVKFPDISEKLHNHFIRGLWTGSGTVYLEKGYMLRSKIVIGSIKLISEVEKILHSQGLSKRNLHMSSNSKKPSYSFRYNTIEDQKKLFKYLYKGSKEDTREERQYHLYKSYFSSISKPSTLPPTPKNKNPASN